MNYQLIIFAGGCPGAGKSTLSSFLFRQLGLQGINARWFYEDDVYYSSVFEGVPEAVLNKKPGVFDVLLEAAGKLVAEAQASQEVFITDSLLPFFNWLFTTNYSFEEIEGFSRKLEPILAKINPLVIYLDIDVAKSLQRAFSNRGAGYQTAIYELLAESGYFKERQIQPTSLAQAVDFFEKNNQLNLTLLAEWNIEKLILNSTSTELPELKEKILQKLDLIEFYEEGSQGPGDLQPFLGIYTTAEAPADKDIERLQIGLRGSELWVDTYWPDGCRLVSRSETEFQLESTNQYLAFKADAGGMIVGLTFLIGSKRYSYIKKA